MKLKLLMVGVSLLSQSCSGEFVGPTDYNEARALFWEEVYPVSGNTLYCGKRFNTSDRRGVNVEHVFPMSWATKALDCGTRKQCRNRSYRFNKIEADLHNLYPAREDVNKERGSFRFGDVRGEKRRFGQQCDFEVDYRYRVAEPTAQVRGDVARAMFYMADRYKSDGLVIFKKQALILFDWHQSDPVDAEEQRRNHIIETLQGNRNKFIDQPELLEKLLVQGHFY